MANKRTTPKRHDRPVKQEISSSIIERDILLVILSMLVFSLVGGKADAAYVFPSVIAVAAGEFLSAAVRKISEPDTVSRNRAYMADEMLQGTYHPDSMPAVSETTDTQPGQFRPAKTAKQTPARPAGTDIRGSVFTERAEDVRRKRSSGKAVLFIMLLSFVMILSVVIVGLVTVFNSHRDHIHIEDEPDTSYTESNFYQQADFLKPQIDDALDRLSAGDVSWLAQIGEGDAQTIIDMIDWENADMYEETRYVSSSEPQEAIIRYLIDCGDRSYKLGFKFTGENISEDSSEAVLAGVCACPNDPWDEYYSTDPADRSWDDLTEKVESQTVSVGDTRFYDYLILLW